MTLTIKLWNGVAIRTGNNKLAAHVDCCCDAVVDCNSCPPDTAVLVGTVSDATGDATQLPATITAAWNAALPGWQANYGEIGGTWGDPACSEGSIYLTMICNAGTPVTWTAGGGATWIGTATIVSDTCPPREIVVEYEMLGTGAGGCGDGTFTITWRVE